MSDYSREYVYWLCPASEAGQYKLFCYQTYNMIINNLISVTHRVRLDLVDEVSYLVWYVTVWMVIIAILLVYYYYYYMNEWLSYFSI